MSSDSGILLIRNDGTIQLKGDTKILGEYHLKHRLLAKVKPDGSMGVFMIPDEGINKGKMFAVLPNGPSGTEGVGWERVVSGESSYLRPVFRQMGEKKSVPPNVYHSYSKKPLQSEPEVIDLCDDSEVDPLQENSKTEGLKTSQSSAPTPVMMFTKDSASKLNPRSIVHPPTQWTTSKSLLEPSSRMCASVPITTKPISSASVPNTTRPLSSATVPNTTKPVSSAINSNPTQINVTTKSTTTASAVTSSNSAAPNANKTVVVNGTVSAGDVIRKIVTNIRNPQIKTADPNGAKSLAVPSSVAVTLGQKQDLITQNKTSMPQLQQQLQGVQNNAVKVKLLSLNSAGNTGIRTMSLSNLSTTQIQGIACSVNTKASLNSLNRTSLPLSVQSATRLPFSQVSVLGVPALAVPAMAVPSNVSLVTANTQATTTVTLAASTTANATVNNPPQQPKITIDSVFSLAPVDPIKPWLSNGKNMPLSEVDFWTEAINLKIQTKVLKDKQVRKGCSVVLNRTTSHRPQKLRGCRFKDTQCNVACRKLFIKALMKDLTRKKLLKMKRRKLYSSLSLEIRKKAKSELGKTSEQPQVQNSNIQVSRDLLKNNTPTLNLQAASQVYAATVKTNNSVPNLPQSRYLLVRMNGQNVLFPSSSISSVSSVVPSAAPAVQVSSMNTPRSLLGARINLQPASVMNPLRPNLPVSTLHSVMSLPQLGSSSIISSLSGTPLSNIARPTTPASGITSNSLLTGGNLSNSNLQAVLRTQQPVMRLSVPSSVPNTLTLGQVGAMSHNGPYPVALRAVNPSVRATCAMTVRRIDQLPASRPLMQSQLTSFATQRPGIASASNTVVRAQSSTVAPISSALQTTATTTLTTATSSVAPAAVDEPVSGVAKSKVNKGVKYYFIPGGIKIKYEPKTSGYGDEVQKHKKHKKHKRPRSPGSDSSDNGDNKKLKSHNGENDTSKLLDDIVKVTNETDIEQLSKSEMSAERIKQLREKLHENQRKLEEYLRQVDQ